jgi:hypothetical protein
MKMDQPSLPLLPVKGLAARHYGLIPCIAEGYEAAARVCLDRHHNSPVQVGINTESAEKAAKVEWERADERTCAALNNEIDTTEAGAYACVIAAVELSEGLYAVGRAETNTGADYYVAPPGKKTPVEDFEDCWRLEVSGTDRGNTAALSRLLRRKVQQTKDGNSNLPALAGVIGFEILSVLIQYVNSK